MTTHHLKTIAIAAAALGLSAAAAKADILDFEAQLRGANETPANATRAHGTVTAVLDTDRRALEYTVTYKDLSGPVAVAGFKEPTSPPDDPIVTAPSDPKAGGIHDVDAAGLRVAGRGDDQIVRRAGRLLEAGDGHRAAQILVGDGVFERAAVGVEYGGDSAVRPGRVRRRLVGAAQLRFEVQDVRLGGGGAQSKCRGG